MSDRPWIEWAAQREAAEVAARGGAEACDAFVYWWDGEYEGNCVLAKGHEGDHYDGLSWYDDEMNMKDHEHQAN